MMTMLMREKMTERWWDAPPFFSLLGSSTTDCTARWHSPLYSRWAGLDDDGYHDYSWKLSFNDDSLWVGHMLPELSSCNWRNLPWNGGICFEVLCAKCTTSTPCSGELLVEDASIPLHWWQLQREELPPPNMTLCTVDSIILQATLSTLVF